MSALVRVAVQTASLYPCDCAGLSKVFDLSHRRHTQTTATLYLFRHYLCAGWLNVEKEIYMRPSKIVAAVLAVGIGVLVIHSLSRGTDPAAHVPTVCEDSRLPYPDQAKCSSDLRTALTDSARHDVVAQYQAKLDAMAPPIKRD